MFNKAKEILTTEIIFKRDSPEFEETPSQQVTSMYSGNLDSIFHQPADIELKVFMVVENTDFHPTKMNDEVTKIVVSNIKALRISTLDYEFLNKPNNNSVTNPENLVTLEITGLSEIILDFYLNALDRTVKNPNLNFVFHMVTSPDLDWELLKTPEYQSILEIKHTFPVKPQDFEFCWYVITGLKQLRI